MAHVPRQYTVQKQTCQQKSGKPVEIVQGVTGKVMLKKILEGIHGTKN